MRPARPIAPIFVSLAVLGTWWMVAHNSGDGWVQTLGDLMFGTLMIGLIGPSLFLIRARLEVLDAPADGTAGLPSEIRIGSATRVRIRPTKPPGPEMFVGPVRRSASRDDPACIVTPRRGLYPTLTLHVATAAPFGLQWWTRRVVLPLPSELHVGPRRGPSAKLPPNFDPQDGDSKHRTPAHLGEARGIRQYHSGDHQRQVHWPATAHAGEVMVREMEGPAAEPVTVTVTLPRDPEAAETLAERALGTVMALFDRGMPVILVTTEASGPVTGAVSDRREAGRRLARAVADPGTRPGGSETRGVTVSS